jgi:hypothetical protein
LAVPTCRANAPSPGGEKRRAARQEYRSRGGAVTSKPYRNIAPEPSLPRVEAIFNDTRYPTAIPMSLIFQAKNADQALSNFFLPMIVLII